MADQNDLQVAAYLKALYAQSLASSTPAPAADDSFDSAPFDAGLTQANDAADLNYGNTLTTLNAQIPALQRGYGYTDTGDIDPNNPFGKAQLLQRSYDQAQKGNTNSYAARGQLYSGALQRRKDEDQFNYQANSAGLQNQYATDVAGVAGEKATAQNTLNTSKAGNYWDWVNSQVAARAAGYGTSAPAAATTDGGTDLAQTNAPAYVAQLGAVQAQRDAQTAADYVPTPPATSVGGAVGGAAGNDPAVVAYLKALQAAKTVGSSIGAGLGGRR